jgi:hypothetical protein
VSLLAEDPYLILDNRILLAQSHISGFRNENTEFLQDTVRLLHCHR